jgi:hypothetical protein
VADADSLLPELEELSELVVVSAGLLSPVDLSESPLLLLEPFSTGGLGRP